MRQAPIFLLSFSLLTALFANSVFAQEKLSLEDCYKLAATRNEALKISVQQVEIAEAQYKQALSLLYPALDLNLDQRLRDNRDFGRLNSGSVSLEDPSGGATGERSGSLGRTQFEANVTLSQPIFNGFRDIYIAESTEQNKLALTQDLERRHELLYLDVAELFYQILLFESDLRVLGRSEKVLLERREELQGFLQLGKSRESEVLAAQSDIADLKVAVENTRGLLMATRELLGSLIGLDASSIALRSPETLEPLLAIDEYLLRARERADIRAAAYRVSGQERIVTATERERWPDIFLQGAGYPYEDPDRNRDWELLLRLQVPIFDGGLISGRVDEQRAQLRINQLTLQEANRLAQQDVRVAYSNVESARREAEALRALLETARKNYESQRKDYQFGVVPNLEVLQAIRQMQEAERRKSLAEIQVGLRHERLRVASGVIE